LSRRVDPRPRALGELCPRAPLQSNPQTACGSHPLQEKEIRGRESGISGLFHQPCLSAGGPGQSGSLQFEVQEVMSRSSVVSRRLTKELLWLWAALVGVVNRVPSSGAACTALAVLSRGAEPGGHRMPPRASQGWGPQGRSRARAWRWTPSPVLLEQLEFAGGRTGCRCLQPRVWRVQTWPGAAQPVANPALPHSEASSVRSRAASAPQTEAAQTLAPLCKSRFDGPNGLSVQPRALKKHLPHSDSN